MSTGTTQFPPGSNQHCATQPTRRIRKEWRQLKNDERELFVSTVEQAIRTNRLQAFLDYHIDQRSSFQGHATCGFALWHRIFLLAAEDMLRDIDAPRTSCLTIPYWDISLDYHRQERGECFSVGSCAPGLFHDMMGGVPGLFSGDDRADTSNNNTAIRQFGQIYSASGVLIQGRPVANLTDDIGRQGIVRGDLVRIPIPPSASRDNLTQLITEHSDFDSFTHQMQLRIHDDVHTAMRGFLPTFSSPADVFFWVWHSTIDWVYNLWQACHHSTPFSSMHEFMGVGNCAVRPLFSDSDFLRGGPPPLEYPSGINLQPSSNDTIIMQKEMNSTTLDIRQDPFIGRYFHDRRQFWQVADVRSMPPESSFTYELGRDELSFWKHLWPVDSGDYFCPAGNPTELSSFFTIALPKSGADVSPYPYEELDLLINQWIHDLFPENDTNREDDHIHSQRLQYVSCSMLYTRGTIVDSSSWDNLLADVRSRQETVRGAPEPCSSLWPGTWLPPTYSSPSSDDPQRSDDFSDQNHESSGSLGPRFLMSSPKSNLFGVVDLSVVFLLVLVLFVT